VAKVRVGFFSFTEVTDPSEHGAYNEWHQLDHMPEQFPLDGVVYGQRWVSTPACRRARAVNGAALAPVHYATLYLMADPIDRTLEEFSALGEQLHAVGRFHQHRRAHVSGPLALSSTAAAPRVLVSAEAVPYRPNRGVYVVVRGHDAAASHEGPDSGGGGADHGDELADWMLQVAGVAGVWSFAPAPTLHGHRWRIGNRTVTVGFLDEEPLEVAGALGALVRAVAGGPGRPVEFAGPFEAITPWRWDWFDAEDG
jgi:hypothetical protein